MEVGSPRQPKREDGFNTIYTRGPMEKFIWSAIKPPLVALLNVIADKVIPPSKSNTRWHNTDNLIDLRDRFFQLENNPERTKVFKAIWNFLIIMYDFDPYYQQRLDWVIDEMSKMKWEPREPGRPRPPHWREFENKNNKEET